MPFIFKEVTPNDKSDIFLKEIASLFKACSNAMINQSFFNWGDKAIEDELKMAKCFVLLNCAENSSICAFIAFRDNVDIWEITALGTHPEAINRGLMTQLLREFLSKYCSASKPVQVEVHEGNEAAIRVYSKLGFEIVRKRRAYYTDGADALVMAYLIS